MRPFSQTLRQPLVSRLTTLLAASLAGLACSAPPSATPHTVERTKDGSGTTPEAETSGPPIVGKPNRALHCTPQRADEIADCTSQGAGYHVGPALLCRGVDPGKEVRAREAKEWEQGLQPCTCLSPDAEEKCAMVP